MQLCMLCGKYHNAFANEHSNIFMSLNKCCSLFSNQVMRKKLILFFKRRNHARKQRVSVPAVRKAWWKFLGICVNALDIHTHSHGQCNIHIISDSLHSEDLSWPVEILLGLLMLLIVGIFPVYIMLQNIHRLWVLCKKFNKPQFFWF